jgi:predicted anti-sigma-YlaC factor YlaD
MNGMNEHERARLQLEERALGIIAGADDEWLTRHLGECADCELAAEEMKSAIAMLRSEPVTAPTFLVSRTRTSVRIRARELKESTERARFLGLSVALALVWTATFGYAGYAAYGAPPRLAAQVAGCGNVGVDHGDLLR